MVADGECSHACHQMGSDSSLWKPPSDGMSIILRKGALTPFVTWAEAEYIALSELAKEIIFVVQILHSLGIPVKTPITVHVDNMGTIFMSENATSNQRTRHIDVRHRFLLGLTEEGFLDVVFTNSENNTSDGLSKNVSKDVYERHTPKFMAHKSIVD